MSDEIQFKNSSIETSIFVLNQQYLESRKNSCVTRIVDYLNEEAYLRDLCISNDNYEVFFKETYKFLFSKNLDSCYFKIMRDYIGYCLTEENKSNIFKFSRLIKYLDYLLLICKQLDVVLSENEIDKLQEKIKVKYGNQH